MELLSWVEEAITYRLSISFRKVVSRGEIGEILFALTSTLLSNFSANLLDVGERKFYLNIRMIILEKKKKRKFGKIWENYR